MNPKHHLYVVDDEPHIASTLATILTDHGYEVTFFTDPVEALAVISEGSPAFLLSDVMMPRLTGIELAVKVLHRCPTCKILLMTGSDSIDAVLKAAGVEECALPLLHKPFHPDALLKAIRGFLT